jgi:hypothetical protein
VLVWGISAWDATRARPAAAIVISGDGASVTMAWSL